MLWNQMTQDLKINPIPNFVTWGSLNHSALPTKKSYCAAPPSSQPGTAGFSCATVSSQVVKGRPRLGRCTLPVARRKRGSRPRPQRAPGLWARSRLRRCGDHALARLAVGASGSSLPEMGQRTGPLPPGASVRTARWGPRCAPEPARGGVAETPLATHPASSALPQPPAAPPFALQSARPSLGCGFCARLGSQPFPFCFS